MALKLNERYPGRFDNPSAKYPQGSFKNRTTPGAKDGSYLEKDWANDKEGFFQSLLSQAGITANGAVDAVGASQYFSALTAIIESLSPTPPDASTTVKGIVELATDTETQEGTDAAKAVTPAGLASLTVQLSPPGQVAVFARSAAPSGWLKCNGAAISRTTYSELFAEIGTTFGTGDGSTTFNLPDLRGEFVRGLDDGRGIDAGRALGSSQAGAVGPHIHDVKVRPVAAPGTGVTTLYNTGSNTTNGDAYMTTTGTGIGPETRPRNVALLYCIKI